jgi:hypothetical protein
MRGICQEFCKKKFLLLHIDSEVEGMLYYRPAAKALRVWYVFLPVALFSVYIWLY